MKKRIFIIHGWDGHASDGWFSWLKKELEKNNLEVVVPEMPNSEEPRIEVWVPLLAKLVGEADENTFFIGHSIGCQTILRYLETAGRNVGGAVFVAGWFSIRGLETKEEEDLAQMWIGTEIDFDKIKKVLPKSAAIFSDNDLFVDPQENSKIFKEKVGSDVIILHNQEHFIEQTELPVALEELMRLIK